MTNSSKPKLDIAIATGTRADWGLLKPLADELAKRGHNLRIAATNIHLLHEFGHTVDEIRSDGFDPIEIPSPGNTPAEVTATALKAFSEWFHSSAPDMVVILGDRFEMAGVATAAMLEGIPIVHISGGAVSEGAFDDYIRNSITKMSFLHFPETDKCRERILRMGENPENVVTAGSLGVWNILNMPLLEKDALEKDLEFSFTPKTIMATLHPATLDYISPDEQMTNFLSALSRVMTEDHDVSVILTYPNNDSSSEKIIADMKCFSSQWGNRVLLRHSLGRVRYLSSLRFCIGVAGNSSSGIVEVASSGIPVLDVGLRQQGREHGPAVIHCDNSLQSIYKGLLRMLGKKAREIALKKENPYQKDDTPSSMADEIEKHEFRRYPSKPFHYYP